MSESQTTIPRFLQDFRIHVTYERVCTGMPVLGISAADMSMLGMPQVAMSVRGMSVQGTSMIHDL